MKAFSSQLEQVKLISPSIYEDGRGCFLESYHEKRYGELFALPRFVQDNLSVSTYGVVRGMHFQSDPGQAKLVFVIKGSICDVVVDIRKDSPTYKQWQMFHLEDKKKDQLYIPNGFAHGFCALSEEVVVLYKVSHYYDPKTELGFRFDDPDIGINWPIKDPILSKKDAAAPYLKELHYA